MCTSKDPSTYPTLLHSRCAENERFSSKDSLEVLSNILLGSSSEDNEPKELSPVETVDFCPILAVPPTRRSMRNSHAPQVRMPCVQAITGKTQGKASNLLNLHPEFVERCVNCEGTFQSMKYDPLKKEQRIACNVCKRRSKQLGWKCRRHLCNEAPLKGMGRDGRKFPKTLNVKVPLLKGYCSLQRGLDGKPIVRMECGVLSCYIIAHQDRWTSSYEEKRSEVLAASGEASEGQGVIVERRK